MKAPENIVQIAKEYHRLKVQVDNIEKQMESLREQFIQWEGDTGVYIEGLFIAEEPRGDLQRVGDEWCDQWQRGDDWYTGTYYYATDKENEYVAYTYST